MALILVVIAMLEHSVQTFGSTSLEQKWWAKLGYASVLVFATAI